METAAHPCLSVVMPCFNEAATVEAALRTVLASPWTAEVIVVDDGSDDGSADLVAGVTDPRVRLLRQPHNQGKGAALRRGFIEATAQYVIVQDADLEYDPAEYGRVLAPLLDGAADVVFGSRFHSSAPHRVLYYWHSVGNRLLTTLSNMTTNLNLTDMETCYKAFRREVIQSVDIEEDRFGFEPEITAKVAAAGWRVYEVGITYHGRTYAEGKKINWRDGVHALWCIGRYGYPRARRRRGRGGGGARPPAAFSEADAELAATLDNLDDATHYASWIVDLVRPYVRGDVCEVGSGHGTLTTLLAPLGQVDRVVACEPSDRAVEVLDDRVAGDSRVEVVHGDFDIAAKDRSFDSVVVVNVLEHIEDDAAAMAAFAASLREGGHVVVFAPAFEALYSEFDGRIGHYRRYRKSTLTALMMRAGLEVVEARYVNTVGAAAWWLFARKLGRVPTTSPLVRVYDRVVVPLLRRMEADRQPPVGQSVLCVGRAASTD